MSLFQNEIHPENHLERPTQLPLPPVSEDVEVQRKRMLIALGILLVALVAVVLKDWDFWFPPTGEVQEAVFRSRSRIRAWRRWQLEHAGDSHAGTQGSQVAGTRCGRSSLCGNHRARRAASSAGGSGSRKPPHQRTREKQCHPSGCGLGRDFVRIRRSRVGDEWAGECRRRVELSPQTAQSVSVSVPPDYPLLARQMKVQGAVSLQALISRDGTIQELQILSGPGILAAAAREAVKQWHFKPYLQNGQPVETQARITVNFTISTN